MKALPGRLVVVTLTAGLLCAAGCVQTAPPPRRTSSRTTAAISRRPPAVQCVGTRDSTRRQRVIAQAAARRLYFAREARRSARRRHAPRYIAVQTERNTDSTGEATCMLFDRQSGALVTNLVFDCSRVPQVGQTIKLTTYNATYVGS